MTNRSITRNRIPYPRRPRQWGIHISNQTLTTAGSATKNTFVLSAGVEVSLGQKMANWTISAIRLDLDIQFKSTAVVGDQCRIAWGILVAPNDTIVVGGLSLPSPVTDDADWIAHGGMNVVADVAAVTSRPRFSHFEIRNDSMRKVRENNSGLVLLSEAITIEDPVQIFVSGRVLYLLR